MTSCGALARFPALGTQALVSVTRADGLNAAISVLKHEVEAIDQACSRFRRDSELSRLNAAGGSPVRVSDVFIRALEVSIRAARLTGGDVDPTVGVALSAAGYDRDFALVAKRDPAPYRSLGPAGSWQSIEIDLAHETVRLPEGVQLDLGATAKALAADRAAAHASVAARCGVLISLGGDVAVAGPAPDGGWSIQLADDHAAPADQSTESVAISCGALATSGTSVRCWQRGDRCMHHIIDPATGEPAKPVWKTVTVTAGSCVDANTASTAAIVRGYRAPAWLASLCLPSRLIASDGRAIYVANWPQQRDPWVR
jgi:FAD:protein FMN transferase